MHDKVRAHTHTFDVDDKYPTRVTCTICGFSCPAIVLKSRVNLEAFIARKHATARVLDLLGVDVDGNPRDASTTSTEYNRTFNDARKRQGFTSQKQLDAFYAHYDHTKNCKDCHALNSYVDLSDGPQPTQGQCAVAKALYAEYLKS